MSVDSLTSRLSQISNNPLTNRFGSLFKTKPHTIDDVPVRSASPAEEVLFGDNLKEKLWSFVTHKIEVLVF
jgi:hypothetical protein